MVYAMVQTGWAAKIGNSSPMQTVADLEHARLSRQIEAEAFLAANPGYPAGLKNQINIWVAVGGPKPWDPAGDGGQPYPPVQPR